MTASLVRPPTGMGGFEFVVLSTLRAAQLMMGCVPTVDAADHKATVVAQMEVATGRIRHALENPDLAAEARLVKPA
jgi:DNA-directed RNA polymerase subunit K/omega